MPRFPRDAPKRKVLENFKKLGFEIVREAEHIALRRVNADRSVTPMTIPNDRTYKSRKSGVESPGSDLHSSGHSGGSYLISSATRRENCQSFLTLTPDRGPGQALASPFIEGEG